MRLNLNLFFCSFKQALDKLGGIVDFSFGNGTKRNAIVTLSHVEAHFDCLLDNLGRTVDFSFGNETKRNAIVTLSHVEAHFDWILDKLGRTVCFSFGNPSLNLYLTFVFEFILDKHRAFELALDSCT